MGRKIQCPWVSDVAAIIFKAISFGVMGGGKSATIVCAPFFTNNSAVARPSPFAPPATKQTRFYYSLEK